MSKVATGLAAIVIVAASSTTMAGPPPKGELLLFPKCDTAFYPGDGCPSGPGPWPSLLLAGRSGTMDYSYWGPTFSFDFKGKGFVAGSEWTLVYYKDPWKNGAPDQVVCLGSDTADLKGNVRIKTSVATGSLPQSSGDANYSDSSPGAKIWLMAAADVNCTGGSLNGWNPANILFEYNPIVYTYTGS